MAKFSDTLDVTDDTLVTPKTVEGLAFTLSLRGFGSENLRRHRRAGVGIPYVMAGNQQMYRMGDVKKAFEKALGCTFREAADRGQITLPKAAINWRYDADNAPVIRRAS
jgi:hypothetical protein